jgi:hypothetical protein
MRKDGIPQMSRSKPNNPVLDLEYEGCLSLYVIKISQILGKFPSEKRDFVTTWHSFALKSLLFRAIFTSDL